MKELDKIHYNWNFITNAVFKVDFPKVLELSLSNPPSRFQEKIGDRFPILEEKPGKFFEVAIPKEIKKEDIIVKQEEIGKWDFYNKERSKSVVVTPEWIALEYFKYDSFDEFDSDIEFVFQTFFDIYGVIKIAKRVGMRYINQIKLQSGDPLDWNNLINPALVAVTRDFIKKERKDDVKKSMHMVIIKEKDCEVKFQFGLFNSEYPNTISRKEFALDYDCAIREEIEVHEVFERAKQFNYIIGNWFEYSIEEGLRSIMKGEKK